MVKLSVFHVQKVNIIVEPENGDKKLRSFKGNVSLD